MGIKELLEKDYPDSFISYGDDPKLLVERVSTGSLWLDKILGGGLPKGRMVEFYGAPMSGKTSMALLTLAGVERGAYIDAEKSFDSSWAKKLGIDIKKLLVVRPDTGEGALEIVGNLLRNKFDVVVIDSVAALVPRQEVEKDFTSPAIAAQARLINLAVRKLNLLNQSTCIIFINQIRYKIGVIYGSPETRPGGAAIGFVATAVLRFRRSAWLENSGQRTGIEMRVAVEKNKLGECQRDCHFNFYWNTGIDKKEEQFRLLLEEGKIKQGGGWYFYKEKKYHGKEDLMGVIENEDK